MGGARETHWTWRPTGRMESSGATGEPVSRVGGARSERGPREQCAGCRL